MLSRFSIVVFTLASGLCGIATNLSELVIFRLLQGVFGAALVPMSQAILLDINPPERHGPAMAIWGMGTVLGPIIGPALGGWLTDNLTRSEEHTSELQSLMRISYAVFCLKKKKYYIHNYSNRSM